MYILIKIYLKRLKKVYKCFLSTQKFFAKVWFFCVAFLSISNIITSSIKSIPIPNTIN